MDVRVQLEDRVDDDGDLYRASGNLLLDRLLGATLHACPVGEDEAAADAALERLARTLADEGRRPYVIHSAPGHPPLGGLGYIVAAEEVLTQARTLGIGFDAVVCASGSALTHAGVLVGLRALGEEAPVYGICVRRNARQQGDRVAKVATELAAMIQRPAAFEAGDVEVCDAVHPPGYGRLNDAVREAMALAARHEALLLDPCTPARRWRALSPTCVRGASPPATGCCSSTPADCRPSSPTRTSWEPGSRRRPGRRRADGEAMAARCRLQDHDYRGPASAAERPAVSASRKTHARKAWTSAAAGRPPW